MFESQEKNRSRENRRPVTVPYQNVKCDYLQPEYLKRIPIRSIRTIVELGSHTGVDAMKMLEGYPKARVIGFECHPDLMKEARQRCGASDRVVLVEKAAWDENGTIPFYPVTRTVWQGDVVENPGGSSCFRARGDYLQHYEQEEIRVDAMRLDTYCEETGLTEVDLLCMDVQGAALRVLRGWGDYLARIRYIILEIENRPIYHGQALFPEVDACLRQAGFCEEVRVFRDEWFSDYLYVNTRLERSPWSWMRRVTETFERLREGWG